MAWITRALTLRIHASEKPHDRANAIREQKDFFRVP